jgi:hypothetical protein
MLLVHIIIALLSLVISGFTFLQPSKTKLNLSYFVVALTLVTGSYLVIFGHANLVKTCITGIIYLGFVTAGLVQAHKKIAKEPSL